jgi:hypothetical protein
VALTFLPLEHAAAPSEMHVTAPTTAVMRAYLDRLLIPLAILLVDGSAQSSDGTGSRRGA